MRHLLSILLYSATLYHFFPLYFTVPPNSIGITTDTSPCLNIKNGLGSTSISDFYCVKDLPIILSCIVTDSNPTTEIIWYKNDIEINNSTTIQSEKFGSSKNLVSIVSKIILQPSSWNESTTMKCKADLSPLSNNSIGKSKF